MIFLTGGTGLLGNCVVRELCKREMPVRVLCRKGTSQEAFEGLPVEIILGDLADKQTIHRAVEGCSAVVHSAAYIHIGWQNLEKSRQVNVQGTETIIQACLANSAKMVHISTVDTLPAANNIENLIDESGQGGVAKTPCSYVVSKSEAEAAVRKAFAETGLQGHILHPGFMLAPYDWKPSSGRMMLEVNKSPIVAAPPGGCSFCDARDVASAIVNSISMARQSQNYILAGDNLTYQELWRAMLRATGRKKRVSEMGSAVRFFGNLIDAAIKVLPIREGDVNGAAIAMGSLKHFYTSQLAEAELNYMRRPVDETLADAWKWLEARF